MYFLRCLQVETSSLRLFSVAIWGFDIIKYFSSIHKLHRLLRFEYALAFARIFHDIVNCSLFSFSSHKYLLSSVSLRFFSCLNDTWWLRHLDLNSVAVRPTYVSFFSHVVTVAWYTISFCRHSPSNGQSFLFLQLHVFMF